ncbi:hypothetical protein [Cellulosilyticum sp. I15G10I2]|uniref:hypothetical protein n=1 Tax=Cellulosilyticum sp. I15G10I2 TaxID=1892843 RepID=UPI00085BDC29|nr:hypothetical protein [Cellulosilyticum sp. I15G10I2]
MKKYLLTFILCTLCTLCIIGLSVFSYFMFNPSLGYDILLNTLNESDDFKLTAFYSDISMDTIKGFEITPQNITPLKASFRSYTEGFLPSNHSKKIVSVINNFRKNNTEPPLTYFHDYYEDSDVMIISFTGDLDHIYRIDKQTWQVSTLQYNPSDNLGHMYVSHIKRIADTFVLIGGEVNAYNAFIYTIDTASFTVLQAHKLPTDPSAIYEQHYTIDSRGNSVFISGKGLDILPYQTSQMRHTPLPFEAQYVFSSTSNTIALSLTSDSIHYALLDESLSTIDSGSIPLPNEGVLLIDAFLSNNILNLVGYDPINKRYKNYIALYDLTADKLIYCLGLHEYTNLALLDAELHLPFDRLKN